MRWRLFRQRDRPILRGMRRATFLLLACFLLAAHGGATGIVKQRMDIMVDIGRATKAIRDNIDGAGPEKVREAAGRIAQHARRIPMLFPDGSFHPPSEAVPEIAAGRAAFDALAAKLAAAAEAVAAEANAPRRAFRELAAACKQCHRRFRAEKRR